MTFAYVRARPRAGRPMLQTPAVLSASDVTVVVPVLDDQAGVDRLLRSFTALRPNARPGAVIVVDNLSSAPISIDGGLGRRARLLRCERRGPAAARNDGWRSATTPWVLFVDADCVLTDATIPGFAAALNGAVGYAGAVRAFDRGMLVSYYEAQQTLIPPPTADQRPAYLVTANALVWRAALEAVGGFDESFDEAGGEDIDLAMKLRAVGELSFAMDATVLHEFGNEPTRFWSRFVRYGRGNRRVEALHGGSAVPRPFAPRSPRAAHWICAIAQFAAMSCGYWSLARAIGRVVGAERRLDPSRPPQ